MQCMEKTKIVKITTQEDVIPSVSLFFSDGGKGRMTPSNYQKGVVKEIKCGREYTVALSNQHAQIAFRDLKTGELMHIETPVEIDLNGKTTTIDPPFSHVNVWWDDSSVEPHQ